MSVRDLARAIAGCAVACAIAAAPAAARGGDFEANCGESPFECTTVNVPIDRSGAVPGTIPLYVERSPGGGRDAVFALAGGPGQGNSSVTLNFNADLAPILTGNRFLVVFDQRGTGRSEALNCPELERESDRPIDVRTAACAERLGPKRSLYTTRDSVEDMEAVRQKIGDDKITIYGVSYGTKVAVAYAQKYPQHVDRLILDSVVEPEGQDPFDTDTYAAIPRVMREICRGECRGFTNDFPADVAALAQQLRSAPLSGRFVDRNGRSRTVQVTSRDLYGRLRAGDLMAAARAEYPPASSRRSRGTRPRCCGSSIASTTCPTRPTSRYRRTRCSRSRSACSPRRSARRRRCRGTGRSHRPRSGCARRASARRRCRTRRSPRSTGRRPSRSTATACCSSARAGRLRPTRPHSRPVRRPTCRS